MIQMQDAYAEAYWKKAGRPVLLIKQNVVEKWKGPDLDGWKVQKATYESRSSRFLEDEVSKWVNKVDSATPIIRNSEENKQS
jgi:hypothetical protein